MPNGFATIQPNFQSHSVHHLRLFWNGMTAYVKVNGVLILLIQFFIAWNTVYIIYRYFQYGVLSNVHFSWSKTWLENTSNPVKLAKCKNIARDFPSGSAVKNQSASAEDQEVQVWSLDREDPWRRKWQLILVFLPGKFHGQRSLVGYNPWDHKDTVEQLSTHIRTSPRVWTWVSHQNCVCWLVGGTRWHHPWFLCSICSSL